MKIKANLEKVFHYYFLYNYIFVFPFNFRLSKNNFY